MNSTNIRAGGIAFLTVVLSAVAGLPVAAAVDNCGLSLADASRSNSQSSDAWSNYQLGLAYATGRGVPTNCAKSKQYIQQAAEARYPAAENALGELYEASKPPNYAEAVKWYRSSALAGNARAQYNLGRLIVHGHADVTAANSISLPASQVANNDWVTWETAHSSGDDRYAAAARLWTASALSRDHVAQYHLGTLFESGLGVQLNPDLAIQLYRLAAPFVPEAASRLRQLQPAGTPHR